MPPIKVVATPHVPLLSTTQESIHPGSAYSAASSHLLPYRVRRDMFLSGSILALFPAIPAPLVFISWSMTVQVCVLFSPPTLIWSLPDTVCIRISALTARTEFLSGQWLSWTHGVLDSLRYLCEPMARATYPSGRIRYSALPVTISDERVQDRYKWARPLRD